MRKRLKNRKSLSGAGIVTLSIFGPILVGLVVVINPILAWGVSIVGTLLGVGLIIYGQTVEQKGISVVEHNVGAVKRMTRQKAEKLYALVCEIESKEWDLASTVNNYDIPEYEKHFEDNDVFQKIKRGRGVIEAIEWQLPPFTQNNPLLTVLLQEDNLKTSRTNLMKQRLGDSTLDSLIGVLFEVLQERNNDYASAGFIERHASDMNTTINNNILFHRLDNRIKEQHQKIRSYISQLP